MSFATEDARNEGLNGSPAICLEWWTDASNDPGDPEPMSSTRSALSRIPWSIALPFALFVLHALRFSSWLVDDAGISFAYARNLVHGHGLVAQVGLAPVEGFSNPLWTFLVAPFFLTDPVDPTFLAKLVSLGLILATFVVVARINHCLFGESAWSRLSTAATLVFVSVNTSFVVWTTSGLENPLYVFFASLGCLYAIPNATDPAGPTTRLSAYAGLCAAALALTRPDGVVFFAAFPGVIALQMASRGLGWRTAVRKLAVFGVAAVVPVLLYLVFRRAYFGDFVPNTYHAKGGPSPRDLIHLAFLTREQIDRTYDLLSGMFSWRAGLVGVVLLSLATHVLITQRKTSRAIFLVPPAICSWAIYCLLPRDWMGEYRFASPFFLLAPLVLWAMLAEALAGSRPAVGRQMHLFLSIATVAVAHSVLVYAPRTERFAGDPTVPFATVAREFGAGFNRYAEDLGISDATFLCPDLGGTLYYSRHRIYDLAGLTDRAIAPLVAAGDGTALREYVFRLRPIFIRAHGHWLRHPGFLSDPRFGELYVAIRKSGGDSGAQVGAPRMEFGDYVLREAVRSEEALERLKEKVRTNGVAGMTARERLRPFPRG